jgi:hypothetical protein
MSTSDLLEHHSFPTLKMSNRDVEDGCYSFPMPKLHDINMFKCY